MELSSGLTSIYFCPFYSVDAPAIQLQLHQSMPEKGKYFVELAGVTQTEKISIVTMGKDAYIETTGKLH